MLYKGYKYLFFRVYQWNLDRTDSDDSPELTALLFISLFTSLHLAVFLLIFQKLFNLQIIPFLVNEKLLLAGIVFINLIVNYVLLMRHKRSSAIIQEFGGLPLEKRKRSDLNVAIYFGLLVLVFWLILTFLIVTAKK
jgi:hypothetical protein